ncbi:MAG TPA: phosphatidylglycerophosphatase A [Epsilonproteobacteria bacterium]|nr:phosphatidylglycerophosphatase A [Campylobacterota bacterium]
MTLQKLFLTCFGAGLSPKAPGTVGSLVGLLAGIVILEVFGTETLSLLILTFTIIGIFEINRYEILTGDHDQQEIVVDEVVGMWIAMLIGYIVAQSASFEYAFIIAYILSFLAFRLFDIWKPSTIGYIDRNVKGGLGVMGDDILAGLAGGLLTGVILTGVDKLFFGA